MTTVPTLRDNAIVKGGSSIHLDSKDLLSTYYMPATILSAVDTTEQSRSLPWWIQDSSRGVMGRPVMARVLGSHAWGGAGGLGVLQGGGGCAYPGRGQCISQGDNIWANACRK